MNKKECPLQHLGCLKEKCAWYLVHSKQCAIPLIASKLQLFVEDLYRGPKE
ncbi:MAG: hypothetical protein ABIH76_00320 [Candidatus Bathyarchaeota archaeon]